MLTVDLHNLSTSRQLEILKAFEGKTSKSSVDHLLKAAPCPITERLVEMCTEFIFQTASGEMIKFIVWGRVK